MESAAFYVLLLLRGLGFESILERGLLGRDYSALAFASRLFACILATALVAPRSIASPVT